MRFDLVATTAEEEKLRAQVREFLSVELPAEKRVALGQAGDGYDPEFSRKLAAHGWVAMALPTEFGGRGATAVERFIVAEELMAAQAPISAHWIADRQTAPSILNHGTEAQKQKFLPAIAAAECFFAIGMSEPEAGSDLASVRTRAKRVDGGWLVSGTKVWTTWAQHADWFAVLCRTSDEESKHRGLSQLLVDLKSPGVTVSPIRLLDGDDDFCEVHLDDVFVSDDLVLGAVGSGWEQVTSELAYERYGPERSMSAWGMVRAVLEIAGPQATERVSSSVARLIARHRAIRQLSLAVARRVDDGARPAAEAAVVKDLGTVFEQHAVEVVRDLLELEIDPSRSDRISAVIARSILTQPIFTIRGGTTEVLRSILAKGLRS